MLASGTARLPLIAVVGALLVAVPAASAATQRYASPSGVGTACTSASPCSVSDAVNSASAGDEVIVDPGDYPLTGPLDSPTQVTIHGVPGEPRPRLMFSGFGRLHLQLGSTLRYVEVDQAAQKYAIYAWQATVDQVIARGAAAGYPTASIQNGTTIRNSIVIASGTNARAIATEASDDTQSSTESNVTAIATGTGGVAIEASASGAAGSATIHATNVIARGGPGGASVKAGAYTAGAHATVIAVHSNYGTEWTVGGATITNGGGNQSNLPVFVNAAAGDYSEGAGSPTIDAGFDDPMNGTFDFAGDPRTIGTADIGADEFVIAPSTITGPAGAVTEQSATLNGSVDAHGAPTSYAFEYGPTAAYGSTTPAADAGSGGAVAATVGGLSPETTYHYRLVATNAGGITEGADQTFTTVTPPTAPLTPTSTASTSTTTTPRAAFAGVKLVSTRLSFGGRFVTLELSCPVGTVGRCSGRTKLTAPRPRLGAASSVTLGRARFSIAAGRHAKVRVRVSRAGRRQLARAPRLRGKDTNAAQDGAGQSKTTVAAVTIRRRHH